MGAGKKEANRRDRQGKTGDGMSNVRTKGENFYRSAKKVRQLNVFKSGKAQRNAQGDITKAAIYQSKDTPSARIEPNRKWFGNTRVISQDSLAQFRDAIAKNQSDPYSYLLKSNKLPMSLIRDNTTQNGLKQHQAKIAVETQPFSSTFGPKAQRKRPKLDLSVSSVNDLADHSEKMHSDYLDRRERNQLLSGAGVPADDQPQDEAGDTGSYNIAREAVFSKGQSKRIWNELYKVIDSSDVVIHVLDARDPEGTRCRSVEKYIKEEAPHKHLLFVLNKTDLIPTSVAASWVRALGKEYPTLAFHASINNSFGKGSLISVLRQFSALHANRKQISVGLIGYPNVGKSSIINTLRKKAVAKVAPIPGETKVWQYVTLMKRIYLIDCPGIVPPNQHDTPEDILLRGVVRVENVQNPAQYVAACLRRCKRRHVERTYDVHGYADTADFLDRLARKFGKLLKGGEADVDAVAKMVINDFLRGKIPWMTLPPGQQEGGAGAEAGAGADEGRTGDVARLNKLPTAELRGLKRKRDERDVEAAEIVDGGAPDGSDDDADGAEVDSESFDEFSDEDDDDDDDHDDGDDVEGVEDAEGVTLEDAGEEEKDDGAGDGEGVSIAGT